MKNPDTVNIGQKIPRPRKAKKKHTSQDWKLKR